VAIPVRFDDRLQTVLRQPASDRHDAAVRWRQLVDLIARAGPAADSQLLEDSLSVIKADGPRIDEPLRAAAARAIAALPLPLGLLQCFVEDELAVSAPILAAASLDVQQWQALLDGAGDETRRFVETIHPELALAKVRDSDERLLDPAPSGEKTIGEMVERIERRRRQRNFRGATPPQSHSNLFRWECTANGEIAWVDGAPRGALIGRSIARPTDSNGDRLDPSVVRAFTQRAPFADALLAIAGDGAVAGQWKISGVPAFDPSDGRFAGYRGLALRDAGEEGVDLDVALGTLPLPLDGDSLRELVHEIKTPLNAIIGFAEIIDGQYLGPAGRRYRDRATDISDQARVLLGAIDDLDLAAQSSARITIMSSGLADFGAIAARAANKLRSAAERRGVELDLTVWKQGANARVDTAFFERLVERVLDALIELAVTGERIQVTVDSGEKDARVTFGRPLGMTGFREEAGSDSNGGLGGLFSLRLSRGLARIAGGDIDIKENELPICFPAA